MFATINEHAASWSSSSCRAAATGESGKAATAASGDKGSDVEAEASPTAGAEDVGSALAVVSWS